MYYRFDKCWLHEINKYSNKIVVATQIKIMVLHIFKLRYNEQNDFIYILNTTHKSFLLPTKLFIAIQ